MKNITTDDFRFATFMWSLAAIIVLLGIISGCVTAGYYDHNFDTTCITSGKSIIYETLDGQDYAVKQCK